MLFLLLLAFLLPAGNSYHVTSGTVLTATLEQTVDSRSSHEGDPVRARISGGKFDGSMLEGRVSYVKNSGKLKGQSVLNITFYRINFPNGRWQNIRGDISFVYGNKTAKNVDEEGSIRGSSRSASTAKRTGGGAAVGAIIGAIAGGGKGAAIGAGVGAAAGAGSNIIRGKDYIRLPEGTKIEVKIR
ncbi:MAG: hypothetical protein RMM17_10570 [Acidobacteriota bacterium]|nr:hypothetical protein [Blastocatellia bacterium]MDW8413114.1 hypothetical protein [Acidobacteriota bacterium]